MIRDGPEDMYMHRDQDVKKEICGLRWGTGRVWYVAFGDLAEKMCVYRRMGERGLLVWWIGARNGTP